MMRLILIVVIVVNGLALGCSRGSGERLARWTATCEACSWRKTGLVKHGVEWKDGDRCPNDACRGHLIVQVFDKGTPPRPEDTSEQPEVPAFGLERYSR
ncbi:MAG: hypothetical protein KJS77_10675 [Planctomycetes bacterium]|nr:hypothetical protein [Planctomycetota bacterium]